MSEIKLNLQDPYLCSKEGKKRKSEIVMFFLCSSDKLIIHAASCPVARFGDCEICKKLTYLSNILVQEEKKRRGKLDLPGMLEKGIIEYMVFGDGIQYK